MAATEKAREIVERRRQISGCFRYEEFVTLFDKLVSADVEAWNRVQELANIELDPLAQAACAILFHSNIFSKDIEMSNQYATKCLPWLLQQTDSCSYFCLGEFYFLGIGVSVDKEKGGEYYGYGSKNNPLCQCGYGLYFEIVKNDEDESLNWLKRAANSGCAWAQSRLGAFYICRDEGTEAFKWLRLGADQGCLDAFFNLGCWYLDRAEGCYLDYIEYFRWILMAAEKGHCVAMMHVGDAYRHGFGVAQDNNMYVHWTRRAADKGDWYAQLELGRIYQYGNGDIPVDVLQACKYYQLASDQGCEEATNKLGGIYHFGEGDVAANLELSIKYFLLASDQGSGEAAMSLGRIYHYGAEHVAVDLELACKYYQLAIDQGNDDATEALADLRGHVSGGQSL